MNDMILRYADGKLTSEPAPEWMTGDIDKAAEAAGFTALLLDDPGKLFDYVKGDDHYFAWCLAPALPTIVVHVVGEADELRYVKDAIATVKDFAEAADDWWDVPFCRRLTKEIERIDAQFGEGYAKKHPELLRAVTRMDEGA